MSEHDFEPVRGLPGKLPDGEVILWQGEPQWSGLAREAFHVRGVALYFAAMLVWRTWEAIAHGQAVQTSVLSALSVAPVAALAVGILTLLAWLNSRTTVYTITNKRVVMRFGAAVPKAINIPFAIIEGAALKASGAGAGDLALTLKAPNKLAFLHLWPHARPWRMAAPQPTLRAVPDASAVAALLATAMQGEVAITMTRSPTVSGAQAGSKIALA